MAKNVPAPLATVPLVPTPPAAQPIRKPKRLPIMIRESNEGLPNAVTIEIPEGYDIIDILISVAKHRRSCLTVMTCVGPVEKVTLLNTETRVAQEPIQGPVMMLSLSGIYVNEDCGDDVPPRFIADPPCSSFAIQFCYGSFGPVFVGEVGGSVMASGVVTVSAILTKSIEYYTADMINRNIDEFEEEEDDEDGPGDGDGGVVINVGCAAAVEPNNRK